MSLLTNGFISPDVVCRQVRTLIGAVGLTVIGLKRVRIGGFRLPRSLGFGQFVPLKPNDIRRVLDRGICAQFTGIA